MADAYIDATYVKAHMGTGVHDAIAAVTGSSITQRIESATALVQSYLRNNGWATPTTTSDEMVKLAVLGAFWQMACSTPETNVSLPDEWETHPARVAYLGILSGDAQVTHSLTKASAVGGWTYSDYSTTTTSGRTQRTRRSELEGY